jgi:hypothetical protein
MSCFGRAVVQLWADFSGPVDGFLRLARFEILLCSVAKGITSESSILGHFEMLGLSQGTSAARFRASGAMVVCEEINYFHVAELGLIY